MSVSVILGPTYGPDLWDLRKQLAANRKAGTLITYARLRAPINSDVIDIAVRSDSLYLLGVRRAGGQWHEFFDDSNPPDLKRRKAAPPDSGPQLGGSRWVTCGGGKALSSYGGALKLPQLQAEAKGRGAELGFSGTPADLIGKLASWSGTLNGGEDRLAVCTLIFAICEALRFRSIENACAAWIGGRGPGAAAMKFEITEEMIDRVQKWRNGHPDQPASANDPGLRRDLWTWLPGTTDQLIY